MLGVVCSTRRGREAGRAAAIARVRSQGRGGRSTPGRRRPASPTGRAAQRGSTFAEEDRPEKAVRPVAGGREAEEVMGADLLAELRAEAVRWREGAELRVAVEEPRDDRLVLLLEDAAR